MEQFEYRTITLVDRIGQVELEVLGIQGWEMCGCTTGKEHGDYTYYFKREVRE